MPETSSSNPWFATSMLLIGAIVGYTAALTTGGFIGAPAAPQVAEQPSVPSAPAAPSAPATADNVPAVDDSDHVRGNPDAEISFIEYSDFECPFCQRHHPVVQQVVDEYAGEVNWVYRHFPLSFHPNAQKAAEASECAAELGGNDKFWEYADLLFEKGPDNSQLATYASEIGLDPVAFQDCVDSGKYAESVASEMDAGSAAGVSGTPGNILLNHRTGETRLISGAQSFANFKTAIDEMLAE